MGRKKPKNIQVMTFLEPRQRDWLDDKAAESSRKLGTRVDRSAVVRALINQQMVIDAELEKVWDE